MKSYKLLHHNIIDNRSIIWKWFVLNIYIIVNYNVGKCAFVIMESYNNNTFTILPQQKPLGKVFFYYKSDTEVKLITSMRIEIRVYHEWKKSSGITEEDIEYTKVFGKKLSWQRICSKRHQREASICYKVTEQAIKRECWQKRKELWNLMEAIQSQHTYL